MHKKIALTFYLQTVANSKAEMKTKNKIAAYYCPPHKENQEVECQWAVDHDWVITTF